MDYSHNSETIDKKLYKTPNLYFLGLGHEFITFPTDSQAIDLTGTNKIYGRSRDGLKLELESKIIYRLAVGSDKETYQRIHALYLLFGGGHQDALVHLARKVIRDVAAGYDAYDYWKDRSSISAAMGTSLESVFLSYFMDMTSFQLENFDLPSGFQEAVVDTDIAAKEIEKVAAEKEQALISKNTKEQLAHQAATKIETTANATVHTIEKETEALIHQVEVLLDAQRESFKLIKDELLFTSEELNAFIWLQNFQASQAPKTVHFKKPTSLTV